MAGIIDKIGQYFARFEHEQQQAVALVSSQPPAPPVVSVDTNHNVDHAPRRSASFSGSEVTTRARRSPSVTRRKLLLHAEQQPPHAPCQDSAKPPGHAVPPLNRPLRHLWDGSVGDENSEAPTSWRSLSSPLTSSKGSNTTPRATTSSSVDESEHSRQDAVSRAKASDDVLVVPRKKKIKKRKPPSPESSRLQAAEKERDRSERVANGIALAKERARRSQEEAQHLARAKRQGQREAVKKIKAQLERIEEVRTRRSALTSVPSPCGSALLRQPSCATSLASLDAAECLASCSNSDQTSHPENWEMVDDSTPGKKAVDGNQNRKNSPQQRESPFLAELEARTRVQMLLQLQFRKKCLDYKKRRERLQHQLERTLQTNENKQAQVASLSQAKDATEKQLLSTLDELGDLRKKRHALEEEGRNERLRRQKEAERALQRRLREEEWAKLMEEEKVRSAVAAEAREKASERVQKARWSASSSKQPRLRKPSRLGLDFLASLSPELAEFEEEGLNPSAYAGLSETGTSSEADKPGSNQEEEARPFEWLVPPFDHRQALLLTEMLSDDEGE